MTFRFKQFGIDDSGCSMKVGTDSVLLGAWADLPENGRILDIGTGCGLLALMAAQRSKASIYGIEIDEASAHQAVLNFSRSPWSNRLEAQCISLQEFANAQPQLFSHILTNPPYFVNSLKAPEVGRSRARHNDELPFEVLATLSFRLLTPDGKLSLVLPVNEAALFRTVAEQAGFHPNRILHVRPFENRPANRILMEFGKTAGQTITEEWLSIRGEDKNYTAEYKTLTRDFYLNF